MGSNERVFEMIEAKVGLAVARDVGGPIKFGVVFSSQTPIPPPTHLSNYTIVSVYSIDRSGIRLYQCSIFWRPVILVREVLAGGQ